jgi:signal transduction histidine kinase
VVPTVDTPRINLAGSMAWLKDEGGALSLDDVRQSGQFTALPSELSAGFTPAAVWLRVDVAPTRAVPSDWLLVVVNALLDDVRLYTPRSDGSYAEHRSGEDVPREQWQVDYRAPAFPLQLSAGQTQRLYLRIWARNAISTQVVLWQAPAFAAHTRNEAFIDGIYYGIFGLILVFHVFFGYWTRERLALWYVPYVAINFLAAVLSAGYVQRITGLSGASADMILGVTLCLVLGISNTFVVVQLEATKLMPRYMRSFLSVGWALFAVTSLAVLTGYYAVGVGVAQMASLASIATLVPVGVYLAWRGHKPARFFLMAFGIFYVAVVLRYFRNLGLLPPMFVTEYGVPISALLHMVIMSLGITGRYNQIRRDMQAAQEALNQSLEAQVSERTAKLVAEIARREAQETETRRALDAEVMARLAQHNFVATVSHEFRTPLAIINTVAQQLARQLDAPREKSLQRCTHIREATQRMTDMMDEFLSADRVGTALHINPAPFAPRQFMTELLAEWKGGQLEMVCNGLPVSFTGDAALIRVALRNLIANALQHSPPTVPVRITVDGTPDGGLIIRVADQGNGIPEDEIPKLFQKYFRGRGAQGQPGAGLGLYLVESIAVLHGGSVCVDSALTKGTTLILTLPCSQLV